MRWVGVALLIVGLVLALSDAGKDGRADLRTVAWSLAARPSLWVGLFILAWITTEVLWIALVLLVAHVLLVSVWRWSVSRSARLRVGERISALGPPVSLSFMALGAALMFSL